MKINMFMLVNRSKIYIRITCQRLHMNESVLLTSSLEQFHFFFNEKVTNNSQRFNHFISIVVIFVETAHLLIFTQESYLNFHSL